MIVLDKSLTLSQRIAYLNKFKERIESNLEIEINIDWTCKRIVTEYDKLSESKKSYMHSKQKERAIEESKKIFEEECQFKPQINENLRDEQSESSQGSRYETLYKHYQEKEDKILCNKLTAMEKELSECSFAPKILANRISLNYSNKSEKREKKTNNKTNEQTRLDRELEECTFKPKIIREVVKVESEQPRGYKEFIEKSRKIIETKLNQKEKSGYENYEKFKLLKFNPPSFLDRKKESKNILLYIDVNVAQGKKGKIALREGDNPKEIADNFCKIYSLGQEYQDNLEEALVEQLNDLTNNSN